MITDIKILIDLCEQELVQREYNSSRHKKISEAWLDLVNWMIEKEYPIFNEQIGFKYCDENYGWHDLTKPILKKDRAGLRVIRMLISYQKDGDFEFRTPSVIRKFTGSIGKQMEEYLKYLSEDIGLMPNTISNKTHYLHLFNEYLEQNKFKLMDVNIDLISDFYKIEMLSLASIHNCNSTLRLFLKFAFDKGITNKDLSIYILPDNYKKSRKLPTTYEESEIRKMIKAVDRASAIGKRDYIILLLAAEFGWRSTDIVNFSFNQIDWEKNIITFNQHKTDVDVNYPLLASIGNAIIDYLKFGRPNTKEPEIIVSHDSANRGKKLNKVTIHSVVTKYMRKANIKYWDQKKHGAHSLRHSLASNMLKKNISVPIISTVLGHQNTESTKIYLAIDYKQLKLCSLPIPPLKSDYYREV